MVDVNDQNMEDFQGERRILLRKLLTHISEGADVIPVEDVKEVIADIDEYLKYHINMWTKERFKVSDRKVRMGYLDSYKMLHLDLFGDG